MKEHTHISDGLLAHQMLEGDIDAFDTLVRRYSDQLLSYIDTILKSSGQNDASSDVLQNVLLRLYRSLPVLATDTSLKPWLYRVAHNCCIDEIRKHQRQQSIPLSILEQETVQNFLLDTLTDTAPSPEDIVEQHDMEWRVQAAICALPLKFRIIVALRYSQQLNFREIAQRLEMPTATVKTYFHRALPFLRASLGPNEDHHRNRLQA